VVVNKTIAELEDELRIAEARAADIKCTLEHVRKEERKRTKRRRMNEEYLPVLREFEMQMRTKLEKLCDLAEELGEDQVARCVRCRGVVVSSLSVGFVTGKQLSCGLCQDCLRHRVRSISTMDKEPQFLMLQCPRCNSNNFAVDKLGKTYHIKPL
jgi:hypothetical protein